jgi:2-amino-4-hydroxy-6-hydroxymethyldihydropteridine diphosphokinase
MKNAVLSLGSNLGNRKRNIISAIKSISLLPDTRIVRISGLYRTKPEGYLKQPDFLNTAVLIETGLSPRALLGGLLGIEAALGRVRRFKNGPRTIDIDLLVYEGVKTQDDELTLPHPRMGGRAFVMAPLAGLFPDGKVLGFDFKREMDLLAGDNTKVKKIRKGWEKRVFR